MPESHCSEDVIEVVGGEEVLLLDVEEVEAQLEHLDLVHLQRGRLSDLVKVDVRKLGSTTIGNSFDQARSFVVALLL